MGLKWELFFFLGKEKEDWVLSRKIELQMQVVGLQSEPSISDETKHMGESQLKVHMNIFWIYYIWLPQM